MRRALAIFGSQSTCFSAGGIISCLHTVSSLEKGQQHRSWTTGRPRKTLSALPTSTTGKPLHHPTVSKGGFISSTHQAGRKSKSRGHKGCDSYLQTSIEPWTLRQVLGAEFHVVTGFLPTTPRSPPRCQMQMYFRPHGSTAETQPLQNFHFLKLKV